MRNMVEENLRMKKKEFRRIRGIRPFFHILELFIHISGLLKNLEGLQANPMRTWEIALIK